MTDHYDQSGAAARYKEEQRRREDIREADEREKRLKRPVTNEGITRATNEFRELIDELNAHMDRFPHTFSVKANRQGRIVGMLATEL